MQAILIIGEAIGASQNLFAAFKVMGNINGIFILKIISKYLPVG